MAKVFVCLLVTVSAAAAAYMPPFSSPGQPNTACTIAGSPVAGTVCTTHCRSWPGFGDCMQGYRCCFVDVFPTEVKEISTPANEASMGSSTPSSLPSSASPSSSLSSPSSGSSLSWSSASSASSTSPSEPGSSPSPSPLSSPTSSPEQSPTPSPVPAAVASTAASPAALGTNATTSGA